MLAKFLQIPGLIDICEARIQQRNRLVSKDNTIVKDMELLLTSQHSTDISFFDPSDPASEPLKAHRFVFAARCPYYNALWRQGWKEAEARQLPLPSECSMGAFRAFVQFLYTDKLEVSGDDAVDLLALAHEMDMSSLKYQCDRFISDALDPSTAIPLLQIAETYDANRTRFAALDAIAKNKALKTTEEYRSLPESLKTLVSRHRSQQPNKYFAASSSASSVESKSTSIAHFPTTYDDQAQRALMLKQVVQKTLASLAENERVTEMEILSPFLKLIEPVVKGQVQADLVEQTLDKIERELGELESIFPPVKKPESGSKCSVM